MCLIEKSCFKRQTRRFKRKRIYLTVEYICQKTLVRIPPALRPIKLDLIRKRIRFWRRPERRINCAYFGKFERRRVREGVRESCARNAEIAVFSNPSNIFFPRFSTL